MRSLRTLPALTLVVAAAWPLVAASPAAAGTASVHDGTQGRGSEPVRSVVYIAAPGEQNHVTARLNGTQATLTDTFGITPGNGCGRPTADPTTVTCDLGPTGTATDIDAPKPAANAFTFLLGDGDDTAAITGSPTTSANLDGGPGNDVLDAGSGTGADPDDPGVPAGALITGGPGNDTLTGGPGEDLFDERGATSTGSDTIRGLRGADTVTYARRTKSVRVTLAGGRDDGSAGERDQLEGIESAVGGSAADTLVGAATDDVLVGGGGADRLAGRTGDDTLFAGSDDPAPPASGGARTADRLSGGPGQDTLVGSAGANRIDGGTGGDTVDALGGADHILARDRSPDRLECGLGTDTVRADGRDFTDRACNRVRRRGGARAVPLPFPALSAVGDPHTVAAVDFGLGCPGDLRGGCRVAVRLASGKTLIGTGRYRLRAGRIADSASLRLTRAGRRLLTRPRPRAIQATLRVTTGLGGDSTRGITIRVVIPPGDAS